jgi:hypothetical protein
MASLAPIAATSPGGSGKSGNRAFERLPGNELHHDVRLVEIAGCDETRNVNSRQGRENHLLDLESDDGGRILAVAQQRDLHQQGRCRLGARDTPQLRHRARMHRRFELEAADHLSRFEAAQGQEAQYPCSRRRARIAGSPAARIFAAAPAMS